MSRYALGEVCRWRANACRKLVGVPKPDSRDAIDRQVGAFQQVLRPPNTFGKEPLAGGEPVLAVEPTDQGATADMRDVREIGKGDPVVEMTAGPLHDRTETSAGLQWHLDRHELGLIGRPVGRHDQTAGEFVDYRRTTVSAHQFKAQVDRRSGPSGSEDVAVGGVQNSRVDLDARVLARESVGVHPVRGSALPVEDSRLGKGERSRAQPDDAGASIMGSADGFNQNRRRGLPNIRACGNDDCVGCDQLVHRAGVRHEKTGGDAGTRIGAAQNQLVGWVDQTRAADGASPLSEDILDTGS